MGFFAVLAASLFFVFLFTVFGGYSLLLWCQQSLWMIVPPALVLAVLSASGAAKLSCSPGVAVVASPPYRVHSPSGCAGSADRILNLSERVSQLLPACTCLLYTSDAADD